MKHKPFAKWRDHMPIALRLLGLRPRLPAKRKHLVRAKNAHSEVAHG